MSVRIRPATVLAVAGILLLSGCNDDSSKPKLDTTRSEELTDQAVQSMETTLYVAINQTDHASDLETYSFAGARDDFREALDLNPANQRAALGLAMCSVFVMEDDPDLVQLAKDWEAWDEANKPGPHLTAMSRAFVWPRATLPLDLPGRSLDRFRSPHAWLAAAVPAADDDPPTPAANQAVLRTVIEPALKEALAALASVTDPTFTFTITPRMQGENANEADPKELDQTEIHLVRAGLETALAGVDVALAYRMEPSPYGADGLDAALAPGSTFLKLAADGASRLADARQRLMRAADDLSGGIDFLEDETDSQIDDIIKYDRTGSKGGYADAEDLQNARDFLADFKASLQGPREVTEDFGLGEVTVQIDLSRFFLDPIPDLKALAPDYITGNGSFRWTATSYGAWVFPDPTVHGILPGMTSTEDLLQTFDLCELYREAAPDGAICPCCWTFAPGRSD